MRNDFGEAIDIHVDYSNGTSRDWHTKKGRCVVIGVFKGYSTELVVTVRGVQQLKIEEAALAETLQGRPDVAWSLRPGAAAPISSREIGNRGRCQL